VLQTRHEGKIQIARDLAALLIGEHIETEDQLRTWVGKAESRELLLAISGVGPATAAYLALLAGDPNAVKMDVHLRRFLRQATIAARDDDGALVIAAAARILKRTPAELDGAIWRYQLRHGQRRRRRRVA
jgi:endonuclease III